MRSTCAAAIGRERDGDLVQSLVEQARLDDHLGSELHAGALQIQAVEHGARETAHAAVNVAHGHAEHGASKQRKRRVAEPAMKKRHGAWQYGASPGGKTAALNQVTTLPQLGDEPGDVAEVIAVVRVAHDHVTATRRADP